MKSQLTLGDILQIENAIDISRLCCPDTGIPLWSTIRNSVLRMIVGDMHYSVSLTGNSDHSHSGSRLRQMTSISRSIAHNAVKSRSLKPRYPILLMATGARVTMRDTGYFNDLSGYFVETAPRRTYAIEDLFDWKWPFPRHDNNVLLHAPLRVEGVLKGKLRTGRFREPARTLVELVSQRAKNGIGWDIGKKRRQWLEKLCTNGAASLLPRYRRYQTIFKKMGTQVLIKEEACYGGADNASAILAARNLGIVTAEYQHGTVSSSHIGYNFSTEMSRSEAYRQTLPEYFLTYGSWWGEQINAPVKKITIGNPHRTENLGFTSSLRANGRRILVLVDGHAMICGS